MRSYSGMTALAAILIAILGFLRVINASPTEAGMVISRRASWPIKPTSAPACTVTERVPFGGYDYTPDPWYNPPTVVYETTMTKTHLVDCKGCDLMVVNPTRTTRSTDSTLTYSGTITMPASTSHTYLCLRTHLGGIFPPPEPSSIAILPPTLSIPKALSTPTAAPSRLPRALDGGVPTCTTSVLVQVPRPTFVANPTKTVYARTKLVDEIVDCNWCVLQLETVYAGKSLPLSTVEPSTTIYKALATATQTVCSHGEPVHNFDETNGDQRADRELDLLDLPQSKRTPPPCPHGDCNPEPIHKPTRKPGFRPHTKGVASPTHSTGPEPHRLYTRQPEDEAEVESEVGSEIESAVDIGDKEHDKPKGMTKDKCVRNCFNTCIYGTNGDKLKCRWTCDHHCKKCAKGPKHCVWA